MQLYEVEIKSQSLLKEGQRGFITYFRSDDTKLIASNVRYLYPQYTDPKDSPVVNITPISEHEYSKRVLTGKIIQKQELLETKADIMRIEDYENI